MSADKLYPYAGDHAIQTAVFALEWQGELNTNALVATQKLAPRLKNIFPDCNVHNMVSVNLDNPQLMRTKVVEDIGTVVFSRPTILGNARSLTISRINCVMVVPDYSRWNLVLPEVEKAFGVVLEAITKHKPITAVGLQYTDLFNWKADPADLDIRAVFSDDCPYLPSNIFSRSGLWHSHHGFLEQYDEPVKHARLENVNVNLLENAGERSIQIVTSHRATLADPVWKEARNGKKCVDLVQELHETLHASNKEILKKLLSKEVCKKISLVD